MTIPPEGITGVFPGYLFHWYVNPQSGCPLSGRLPEKLGIDPGEQLPRASQRVRAVLNEAILSRYVNQADVCGLFVRSDRFVGREIRIMSSMDTYHGQQIFCRLCGMLSWLSLSLSAPLGYNTARSSGCR